MFLRMGSGCFKTGRTHARNVQMWGDWREFRDVTKMIKGIKNGFWGKAKGILSAFIPRNEKIMIINFKVRLLFMLATNPMNGNGLEWKPGQNVLIEKEGGNWGHGVHIRLKTFMEKWNGNWIFLPPLTFEIYAHFFDSMHFPCTFWNPLITYSTGLASHLLKSKYIRCSV